RVPRARDAALDRARAAAPDVPRRSPPCRLGADPAVAARRGSRAKAGLRTRATTLLRRRGMPPTGLLRRPCFPQIAVSCQASSLASFPSLRLALRALRGKPPRRACPCPCPCPTPSARPHPSPPPPVAGDWAQMPSIPKSLAWNATGRHGGTEERMA